MTSRRRPSGGDDRNGVPTERQQEILAFHREWVERRGYPPNYREIADGVGLRSTSTVSHHLKILKKMGHLTFDAGRPRTTVGKPPPLRVIQQRSDELGKAPMDTGSQNMVSVPMFERIAAGNPVIANPDCVGVMQLPREMVGSGILFAVRVMGDSMVNASIFDRDYVVVRQQDDARNGDIVAALIEEEATVKTFHRADGHVWLMPQNPSYKPIQGDHCRVMGKVVATVHPV